MDVRPILLPRRKSFDPAVSEARQPQLIVSRLAKVHSERKAEMSHEDLEVRMEQRPFIPFRVVLTEGTSHEIRHPELFMLGKRSAVIGLAKNPEQRFYDAAVQVDLLHIVRLEPLDTAAAAGS
jgi:hypothetical protein